MFTEEFAKKILQAIGGKDNIKKIDNCITRLRLVLEDTSKVNEEILIKETGASKVIFEENNSVHIVYGLKIEAIRKVVDSVIQSEREEEGFIGNVNAKKILEGIGGKDNIKEMDNCISRLRLVLEDTSKVNEEILIKETGASKVIFIDDKNVQVVYGLKIEEIRKAIEEEMKRAR